MSEAKGAIFEGEGRKKEKQVAKEKSSFQKTLPEFFHYIHKVWHRFESALEKKQNPDGKCFQHWQKKIYLFFQVPEMLVDTTTFFGGVAGIEQYYRGKLFCLRHYFNNQEKISEQDGIKIWDKKNEEDEDARKAVFFTIRWRFLLTCSFSGQVRSFERQAKQNKKSLIQSIPSDLSEEQTWMYTQIKKRVFYLCYSAVSLEKLLKAGKLFPFSNDRCLRFDVVLDVFAGHEQGGGEREGAVRLFFPLSLLSGPFILLVKSKQGNVFWNNHLLKRTYCFNGREVIRYSSKSVEDFLSSETEQPFPIQAEDEREDRKLEDQVCLPKDFSLFLVLCLLREFKNLCKCGFTEYFLEENQDSERKIFYLIHKLFQIEAYYPGDLYLGAINTNDKQSFWFRSRANEEFKCEPNAWVQDLKK
jgi:hypothetical protein